MINILFKERNFSWPAVSQNLRLYGILSISTLFSKIDEDIFDAISLKTCVEKRNTIGAPGKEAIEKVISINEDYINSL